MTLADLLRSLVRAEPSIRDLARQVGISQPTLHEFAHGKPDGTLADMRLDKAQFLIDHFGVRVTAPKRVTKTS